MNEALIRIEIERIVNLVAGFGWKKVEEKVSPEKVTITLQKDVPVTEEPRIYAVSRGIVKKTTIVFVVLLMLTTLAAFLMEGIKKSQAQAL